MQLGFYFRFTHVRELQQVDFMLPVPLDEYTNIKVDFTDRITMYIYDETYAC